MLMCFCPAAFDNTAHIITSPSLHTAPNAPQLSGYVIHRATPHILGKALLVAHKLHEVVPLIDFRGAKGHSTSTRGKRNPAGKPYHIFNTSILVDPITTNTPTPTTTSATTTTKRLPAPQATTLHAFSPAVDQDAIHGVCGTNKE